VTNDHFLPRKEHYKELIRETQHYHLVQTLQADQPRKHGALMVLLTKLWRRSHYFKRHRPLQEQQTPCEIVTNHLT